MKIARGMFIGILSGGFLLSFGITSISDWKFWVVSLAITFVAAALGIYGD